MRRAALYTINHGLPIWRTLFAIALFEALHVAAIAALVLAVMYASGDLK